MRLAAVVISLALLLSACTDASTAQRVLEGAGYTNVHLTGYEWAACSKDDTYSTGFTATGPTGRRVSGAVCSSWMFKNATIRLD
ncbi:hypothetical protein PMO31116_04671 [Pandoraea morbifera]|uniref:Lipoprotein n=1 Tax=Pandoraea morbifera TaxID=2508300 RepID=A0A5E4YR36_9BURK|nr:hypothetical protein PMO31116_04671 [Pandoraea morbifera]